METREEKLEKKFVYFTECQLATLEDLRERKKFPKYELERHESIADKMLEVCRILKLKTEYSYGREAARVKEILNKDKKGCGKELEWCSNRMCVNHCGEYEDLCESCSPNLNNTKGVKNEV